MLTVFQNGGMHCTYACPPFFPQPTSTTSCVFFWPPMCVQKKNGVYENKTITNHQCDTIMESLLVYFILSSYFSLTVSVSCHDQRLESKVSVGGHVLWFCTAGRLPCCKVSSAEEKRRETSRLKVTTLDVNWLVCMRSSRILSHQHQTPYVLPALFLHES